jgi:myosin heavy subunit
MKRLPIPFFLKQLSALFCITAICLALTAPPAVAGALKKNLEDVTRALKAVSNETEEAADQFDKISSNAWQLMQMTSEGIDELYVYMNEKLKKKKLKFKDNLDRPISDFSDRNIDAFLKGIKDGKKQATRFSKQWSAVGEGLKADLARLDKEMDDIEKIVAKKKKKWYRSRKYKKKVKNYEKTLHTLRKKAASLQSTLRDAMKDDPPSPAQIKRNLSISAKSTLKDLDTLSSRSIQQFMEQYADLKKETKSHKRKFRQAGDFRSELATIRKWVDEADDMK